MSKRELWEVVRADQLKVGDVIIKTQCARYALKVQHIEEGEKLVCLDNAYPVSFNSKVLRRIPDADDPRVLRRALDLAEKNSVVGDAFGRMCQGPSAEDYIDQARRELESEASDDQA